MDKTPGLHLVLPVTCNDEYCDQRPRIAQVAVTPAIIEQLLGDIRRGRKLKRECWPDLCNVEVFDYSADWGERIDEDRVAWPVHDLLQDADFQGPAEFEDRAILVAQPLPLIVGEDSCRTDCNRRSIYDDRIHWAAYLKHANIEITTESIRQEELMRIAKVFRQKTGTKKGPP